ncbi:MAG: nucleotidyltransferase domain-containing protein [Spirochaetales bacterium]|nr:nucleotidyltransferase domain-containing protein [Spirochaetales bacterium]
MVTFCFESIVRALQKAAVDFYQERLVSLAIFGSVARRAMRPDSDLDLLLVASPLPDGRIARRREFDQVEERLIQEFDRARQAGICTRISVILKTPAEVEHGSLIFLDMIEEAKILIDQGSFFQNYLNRLSEKLKELGSVKVMKENGYYWILKPGKKPEENILL